MWDTIQNRIRYFAESKTRGRMYEWEVNGIGHVVDVIKKQIKIKLPTFICTYTTKYTHTPITNLN